MIRIPKELEDKIQVVQGEFMLDKDATEAEKLVFARFLKTESTTTDRVITFIE